MTLAIIECDSSSIHAVYQSVYYSIGVDLETDVTAALDWMVKLTIKLYHRLLTQ